MISILTLVSAVSMALFVSSAPSGGIENSCNPGSLQCCNSLQSANSTVIGNFLTLLGIPLDGVTGSNIGLDCSPLVGSGSACTTEPVCCSNDSFRGLVAIGCTPISINV